MPALPRTIGVAVDLAGCPNRCRHCYLGVGPNRKLPKGILREVAGAFTSWKRPGENTPYFTSVDIASWYREPDYADDYRELCDLEAELSRRAPRRWELLSVWRLARDPSYAAWAATLGPRVCQITFFGGRKTTDWFCRRRGAFADNLAATERLLEAGMIPRWQIVLTKRGLPELAEIAALVRNLTLRERTSGLGQDFDVFCHLPGPDGEAFDLEEIRLETSDLRQIPGELMDSTRKHFGGRINWEPESDITQRVLTGEVIPPYVPDETWFLINSCLDVFSNFGDMSPAWRLGNLCAGRLDSILAAFENDAPPGFRAAFHAPDAGLARRFGRPDSQRLYSPGDLKTRWIRLCRQS